MLHSLVVTECGQVPLQKYAYYFTNAPAGLWCIRRYSPSSTSLPAAPLEGQLGMGAVECSFLIGSATCFINILHPSWFIDSSFLRPFGSDWGSISLIMAPPEAIAAVVGAWKSDDHLLKQAALGTLVVVGPKEEGINRTSLCTNVRILEPLVRNLGHLVALSFVSQFFNSRN